METDESIRQPTPEELEAETNKRLEEAVAHANPFNIVE
jgi:hypothetical protein